MWSANRNGPGTPPADTSSDSAVWRVLVPLLAIYMLAGFTLPVLVPAARALHRANIARAKVRPQKAAVAAALLRSLVIVRVEASKCSEAHVASYRSAFRSWEGVVPFSVVEECFASLREARSQTKIFDAKAAAWSLFLTALLVLIPHFAFGINWSSYYYAAIGGTVVWSTMTFYGLAIVLRSSARYKDTSAAILACNDRACPLVWFYDRARGGRDALQWLTVAGPTSFGHGPRLRGIAGKS
ncbi:hypothetical protein DFJ77DRAFT_505574 [Powellomyces hirtus]|nr:hypothetical protein DFJ77DRAFT_505574 [Powellomyces hirtus]